MLSNMSSGTDMRASLPEDTAALELLYRQAFPDEDLVPLLRDLLSEDQGVLSLVAARDGKPVGHIVFTICGVAGRDEKVALLGPLAVAPPVQRQGIGGALVRDGLDRMKADEVTQVLVLGDPAYYGRFGFQTESHVSPPYALPEDWRTAWQSISLDGGKPQMKVKLVVPEVWAKPALWAP